MNEPSLRILRLAVALAAPFGVAACEGVPPPAAAWNSFAPPAAEPPTAFDEPIPGPLREVFPGQGRLSPGGASAEPLAMVGGAALPPPPPPPQEAVAALDGDAEAQRFLLLRQLAQDGLIGSDDAAARRAANLGALLPYSAAPPAAGLDRPVPAQTIANRLLELLAGGGGGVASARAAERAFLLDTVLPLKPAAKAPPVRGDAAALREGRARIDTLAAAGLVDADERNRELAALARADQVLAELPPPPAPAKPVKKKAKRRPAAIGHAQGAGVPGGAIEGGGSGPMAVHLLSMASPDLSGKAWDALKRDYPELAPLEVKTVKTAIPDLGTTYRLLAGPLTPADAEQTCRTLRGKGQSCAVTRF
jgi:hypothetical protein